MQAISFSKNGVTTLTFKTNPAYPYQDNVNTGVASMRSAGGVHYSYDKGIKESEIILEWAINDKGQEITCLNAADYDGGFSYSTRTQTGGTQSLKNWILNIGVGPLNFFTFTDHNGVNRTVYLADNQDNFKKTKGGGFIGSVRLIEEH